MSKTLITLLVLAVPCWSVAQIDTDRQVNQGVFNKIEYHFNLGETDSIYALSSPVFRSSLSAEAFREVFAEQLLPLGQIRTASQIAFEEDQNLGSYKLDFEETSLLLTLGLDETHRFSILTFKPYVAPTLRVEVDKDRPTEEKAHTVNDLIDLLALEYTRKPNTHALAIGVLDRRNSARFFYGYRDSGSDKRLPDEDTLFEIGPVSKTFTATLLASLAMSGTVDIDAPIRIYLPDSVAANSDLKNITLKNLANHSSGLPNLPDNINGTGNRDPLNPDGEYSTADLFGFLKDYRPERGPGEAYAYSHLGYGLIGVILSEITGKTYGELINEYICVPLSLTNTTDLLNEEQDLIPAHNRHGEPVPVRTFDALAGAGALKSSIVDMLTYVRAHFDSPDTDIEHALAYTRQFTFFDPPETDIGLAWHIQLRGDDLVYGHTGEGRGSSCYVAFVPDRKMAVIILSNALESVNFIGDKIMEALLNQK